MLVPYTKCSVVAWPPGLTTPFRVAENGPVPVAGCVVTDGRAGWVGVGPGAGAGAGVEVDVDVVVEPELEVEVEAGASIVNTPSAPNDVPSGLVAIGRKW
jgi:hypothetical protein